MSYAHMIGWFGATVQLVIAAGWGIALAGAMTLTLATIRPDNRLLKWGSLLSGLALLLIGLGQASGAHLLGTSSITDDEWHHLAGTVDRDGAAKLYRDGVFEAEMDIAGSAKENEDNLLNLNIGADSGNRWFLQGLLDEVALFKTVLTEDDINRIMNEGLERVLGITAVSPADKLTSTWANVKTQSASY